jgi:hypothetical protein
MAATVLLFISCAPKEQKQKGHEWAWEGSGAFDTDEGRAFYGVGTASGIKSQALLEATADNRARAEVAKIFDAYVAILSKDYMASTKAGDMSAIVEEQHVGQALRVLSMTGLNNAAIVDHWMDPDEGTLFSLCRLDLAAFKSAVDDLEELDGRFRDYIRGNAEKIHEKLEKMERK